MGYQPIFNDVGIAIDVQGSTTTKYKAMITKAKPAIS